MDLVKYIVYQSRQREDEPAIAFAGGVATYGHLVRAIESTLDRLSALPLTAETVVALDLHNPFRHSVLMLALALQGVPSASITGRSQVEFAGVTPAVLLTDKPDTALAGSAVHVVDDSWFNIDPDRPVDFARLNALPGFSPGDVARVVFSSGTTGRPKAVALTADVLQQSMWHGELTQAGPHAHAFRAINMMGFSTVGSMMALVLTLSRGGLLAYANGADDALRLIRAFRLEILCCAVVQLQGILRAADGKGAPPSLKTVIAAGAKIPRDLLLRARALLCPNVNVMYGSTEAGPVTFGTGAALDAHEGSAGYVLPWVELQTVRESGEPVPPGSDGIVRIRSAEQSYYLVPSPDTDAMFRDGWFYPGDVARLIPDGLLAITGRVGEIINRGGVIVAPDMIEEVLRTLPGIKDVAVFGAPDADGVEEIWAAVVSDQWVDAQAIKAIASVRLPDRTPEHVVQVDTIPRNEMGKVQRNDLRASVLSRRTQP